VTARVIAPEGSPAAQTTDAHASSGMLSADSTWFPVTVAVLAAVGHGGLSVFFYKIGHAAVAHWDVVAVAVHLTGAVLIFRGRRMLGLWIVLGSAAIHSTINVYVLGIDSGWGSYFVTLLFIPFVFFQTHSRHMLAAVLLCATAAVAGLSAAMVCDPIVVLDPDTLRSLHVGNVLSGTGALSVAGLLIVKMTMRTQRRLARLRDEVREAKKLGQYTLGERLGAGGMGQVYRANHAMLRRPAAIKLIKDGEVAEATRTRFNQEVEATAGLCSPHAVDIYDFGRTQAGELFYVMELLDGINLQDLVERYGPLPSNRVVHLLIQVCHSLEEAHSAGMVHRDIKPANLFICRYGTDRDFMKVLDFGLVKDVDSAASGSDLNLTAGMLVGTPACMPPEMALGEKEIDGRADIYALGCVAYWLLTGSMLFADESPMKTLMKHVNEKPGPPSAGSELPIPPELDALVLKCLDKDPGKRPSDAEDLAAGLSEIPLGQKWLKEDARRWWETHRPA
jgi:tRNA A-37 threonylcarbamoyl transferase component Bud32